MSKYLIPFDDYNYLWESGEHCEFCKDIDKIYNESFSLIEFIKQLESFKLSKKEYKDKVISFSEKHENKDSHMIFYLKEFLNILYKETFNDEKLLTQLINIHYNLILDNFKNLDISFLEYLKDNCYYLLLSNNEADLKLFNKILQDKLKNLDIYYIVDGYSLLFVYERLSKDLLDNIAYLKTIPTNHELFMNEVYRQYDKDKFNKTLVGNPHNPTLIHSRWCQKCARRKPSIYDSEREIKDYGKNE